MSISLAQFADHLVESGLLSRVEVQASLEALPANQQPQDGQQLARLLVQQKKLTSY